MNVISTEQIERYLPHRYPFLLVDRVIEIAVGKCIKAYKNLSFNEAFFQGHFPSRPIMPGVLMIEAMAQAAGILTMQTLIANNKEQALYFLASVDAVRFKRVVEPGDQLVLEIDLVSSRDRVWKFKGKALVGDELACQAEFVTVREANP